MGGDVEETMLGLLIAKASLFLSLLLS